jgi:TolB-like protein/DNA-binding winged helix-turn-helix (wHTH) protein
LSSVYRVGDLVVDLARQRVTRAGQEIELSKLSYELLAALVRAAPDLVPLPKLMDLVWPGLVVGPETIVQRVKLVRDALGEDSREPRYIGGVRGRGYRIVAHVAPETSSPMLGRTTTPTRRPATRIAASIGIAMFMLVALAVLLYGGRWGAPTPPAAVPTLAVLPFEDLSPDPSDGFFAVGLHDDVINALAETAPQLRVIARATMATYRDRPRSSAGAIARELDATHVLAATVRRDAAVVRLTLEIIDAKDDTAVWSRVYERTPEQAPGLRAAVAIDVTARLAPLGTPSQATATTANAAAYDHYLQALVARPAATSIYLPPLAALDAVEQPLTAAIELDPTFGAAYAERAAIRIAKLAYNFAATPDNVQSIVDDIAAAGRVAPAAPKTLAARSWYLMYVEPDAEAALEAYTAAERAGLADPLWMLSTAAILGEIGRTEQALRVAEHALSIDPKSPVAAVFYAYTLDLANRPVDAARVLDFALEQAPDDPALRGMRAYTAFAFTGDLQPLNASVGEIGEYAFPLTHTDDAVVFERAFQWYRWNDRLGVLGPMLDAIPDKALRSSVLGAGLEPLARYQGWTSLLRGDRDAAAARGARVLSFIDGAEETSRNRLLLKLLEAEAYTFTGESERALAAAQEAFDVRATVGSRVASDRVLAAVYAWNGAADAALDILERLTSNAPHAGPAEVARDPLFTLALADNARFAQLVARLEAEMQATRLD